jgi:hypothetical protein
MGTFKRFQLEINSLPKEQQSLFCCGACEHILPFFEYFRSSSKPRELLNAEWSFCLGSGEQESLTELAKSVSEVIPDNTEEDDLPSQIAMFSAVPVLEVLDLLLDKRSECAVRAASAPLEVLQLVHLFIDEPMHAEFELFDIVDNPSIVPKEIHHEWNLLGSMLRELSAKAISLSEWRGAQVARGSGLIDFYREQLNRTG